MAWYLDTFVDRREGGIEIVATHKWVMPCNWKFPAENFGGDAYHVQWSHGAAIATGFSVGVDREPGDRQQDGVAGQRPCPDLHRARRLRRRADARDPGLRARDPARGQAAARAARGLINPIVGTVFPNFSLLRGTSRTFRVWHPRGPDKTEIWSWVFVDKAAPPRGQGGVPAGRGARLQPGRHLRAGRHGQLAGMHPDLPRRHVAAHADQQPDGARA